MKVGSVLEIRRYPVKSMDGEVCDEVRLGNNGILGDRAWAVRDEIRGGIRGAKQLPALMKLSARYAAPPKDAGSSPAEITPPDGSTVDVNARLSDALQHKVSLWPLLPADALVRETGGNLGVYATVETPGVVRVGDAVELLSDGGYVKPQRAWLRRLVFAFRVTLAMMRARRRKKRAQRGG